MAGQKGRRQTRRGGRSGRPWNHVQLTMMLLAIALLLTMGIGATLYWFASLGIPDVSSIERYQPAETTLILDRYGKVLARVFEQNRFLVPLAKMPPLLPRAFVAAEDARFFEHGGLDVWSILRALLHNLKQGSRGQGGSTITQQVTRALLLSPEKTYIRKFKEAILAYRLDRLLTKEEILYIYLNEIYLGEGAYGVEAAAQTYFGKHVGELQLAEIALLAGLPQAPSRYSPFADYRKAKHRQAYVLNRMAADGYITPTMARAAYDKALLWSTPRRDTGPQGGYFVAEVKKYIRRKYGGSVLLRGGLTVATSLDPELQRAADVAVGNGIKAWQKRHKGEKDSPQAALLAVAVDSGEVLAMTGGVDFGQSQFNRAVQARRQPGSAFKPLVYAAALAAGKTPATMIEDAPLTLTGAGPGEHWQPRNFDNIYRGPVTLRQGLIHSYNIVTIKLLQEVGLDRLVQLAKKAGISTTLPYDYSLALGASELTLAEMVRVYAGFARGGQDQELTLIREIRDRHGRLLEKAHPERKRFLEQRVCYQLTDLLRKVISEGTGRRAAGLGVAAAGKTGTTDNNVDAWFIGYTPEVTAGVWMGFDRYRSLGPGETGGRAAAPVWRAFMAEAGKKYRKKEFTRPAGLIWLPVNSTTGEIGLSDSPDVHWEVFRAEDGR